MATVPQAAEPTEAPRNQYGQGFQGHSEPCDGAGAERPQSPAKRSFPIPLVNKCTLVAAGKSWEVREPDLPKEATSQKEENSLTFIE
jgi:hypothetical protein